ncbi:thioester reductase domain-containing protein [Nocardia amikacinitolerans]|uniref:Thioester reductase domain-containing protein n=1 Tax=Nocardia amikacinitolerans TaxID=756689 RepID=A0A285LXC2_9NOCA|nr:thioester reductase domain-containing protein [Nocardia amikacinitolerans]MCP2298690.1 thioester reductase domain-containing protein [Nocardia amikacinitolerans]SNY89579.1 thioester reductase domain-containing protein [Nocardia amikacinitolerans]
MTDSDERTTVRNPAVDRRGRGEALERGVGGLDVAALLARTGGPSAIEILSPATDVATLPTNAAAPTTDAEAVVAAVTALANRFTETTIDADTDFFDAGGTSIAAVEFVAALARELDIHLDLDTVFFDARPRRLAHRWLADHPETGAPQPDREDEADTDDLAQLFADLAGADLLPVVAPPERVAPRRILLTGATGFLGSHLLLDLLRHSEAHVVCLVRAADDQAATERLEHAVRRFMLPWSREVLRRVTPLAGDLREPRLGLSDERWATLAAEVDSIVNAGAAVDFLRGYPSLRRTNVLGPLTLAELACTGKPKPVHHISSLAVFNGTDASALGEDDPTANVAALPIGYDRSKWAAEAVLRRTGEHGLVVTVLRPGGIGSHPETGAHNSRDLNAGITAALMRFRTAPGFRYLNSAPVDWVSRVAAEIVGTPSAWGHTYHLTGAPTTLDRIVAETTLGGIGIRVQHWEQWCDDVVRRIREEPVPELESLAQVLQSPVARRQLAAMVTAPPASAARTEAFVSANGLPAPATPGPAARGRMLAAMTGLGPRADEQPYLRFNETLAGMVGPIGEPADIPCELRLTLSVASSAQVFTARTLDVTGELTCAGLHPEPLAVEGTATVRPHDGLPLRHEVRHPIMHYRLTLRDASGGEWWLAGYKFAAARRRLVRQLGTQVIELGRAGEAASYTGEVAVPMHTYLPDQIDGIQIDPRLPERQRRLAKMLWLSWFGGQLGKSLVEPFLRVGTDLLDLRRAMKEHRR